MIELDNLHYDFREIDGYNKPFNFILSARELGKTSMFWLKKIYLQWKKDNRPWIYLVRKSVEISSALIDSISDTIINKFTDDNVVFRYQKGNFKDGIVDVFINDKIFFRIVSLNIDLRRIKLAVLKNIKGVLMDEYIIDTKTNERYINNEAFKIKEAYTTWRREAEGILKVYILANPYSLFNPLFLDWKVDIAKLKKNSFYVGDTYVIHWAILKQELREKLLTLNPLYEFDEDYKGYAIEGSTIRDNAIKTSKLPSNFYLKFIFRINDRNIGVFKNAMYNEYEDRYFCKFIERIGKERNILCFELEDLISQCKLLSLDDKMRLNHFKDAMRLRLVSFEDINVYYLTKEVFSLL